MDWPKTSHTIVIAAAAVPMAGSVPLVMRKPITTSAIMMIVVTGHSGRRHAYIFGVKLAILIPFEVDCGEGAT